MANDNHDKIGYYTGTECAQFAFLQLPKELISNESFANISMEAKVLYAMMLDRLHLSLKNKWFDENGRAFIIMSLDEVQEKMHCGKDKACDLLAELDSKAVKRKNKTITGCGLIERKKRGLGKPDIIYPKKFTDFLTAAREIRESENAEVQNSEKQKSGLRNTRTAEFENSDRNNTDNSSTENSNTNNLSTGGLADGEIDKIRPEEKYAAYERIIRENVNYELFENLAKKLEDRMETTDLSISEYHAELSWICPTTLNRIIGYMVDVLASDSSEPIIVLKSPIPREVVKNKLLKIDYSKMRTCIHTLYIKKPSNPRNYAISTLYSL